MSKKLIASVVVVAMVLSLVAAYGSSIDVASAAAQRVEHSPTHDDPGDYIWDSETVTYITLNGDSISVEGNGASANGSVVTIGSAGTYNVTGSLTNGQVIVDTQDEAIVRLILENATINNATSAPVFVANAEEAMIVLADNSQNYLTDGSGYVFASADEDEPNAALFSKVDLTISGNGALVVTGNYNDGIASKDGLVISGGTISVSAVDDGIRGKDYVVVNSASVVVNAQGDGLKADNDEDASRGYITVESGAVNVTSGGDAIQATTDVTVMDGNVIVVSGGGSSSWVDETVSAKGIKGTVGVTVTGGSLNIDSADDAIHSNDSITINGGTFVLASGDDGMHADTALTIKSGTITITTSYEGLESAAITINGGDIDLTSSDDGINVAGGNDGSGMAAGPGRGGRGGAPADQAQAGGQDAFAATGDYYLKINGGTIVMNAGGDGLDSNGWMEMTNGVVIVNGPVENMNGAIDVNGTFNITGGFLVAVGSSGMAESPSNSSSQYSLLLNFNAMLPAGTLIHIRATDGNEILTFAPAKQFQSIVVSSPELVAGGTYEVYTGGSASGAITDGLYEDGTYSAGAQYTSFTVSSVVTQLGASGMGGGRR